MTHSKQRRVVRFFPRGSFVEIYSQSQQRWILDGEVAGIVYDSCVMDGVEVSAGSTKIIYDNGKYYRWVASAFLHEMVRESGRRLRPNPEVGRLMWRGRRGVLWKWCYALLHSGHLHWWDSAEDAAAGSKPVGAVHLLGVHLEEDGPCVALHAKSDAQSARSGSYTFKVQQEEEWAGTFVAALQAHIDWCEEDRLFLEARPSDELLGRVVSRFQAAASAS